jgi:hypothetical protein
MIKPSLAASFSNTPFPSLRFCHRQLIRNFPALGIDCLLSGALCGPLLADSNTNRDSGASCYAPINMEKTTGNVAPIVSALVQLAQKYCPTILETY